MKRLGILVCALALLAGCSKTRPSGDQDAATDVGVDVAPDAPADVGPDTPADAAPDAPDAALDAGSDPAERPIALVVVEVAPTRAVHRTGRTVTPSATLYDDEAETVGDARAVRWRVEPEVAAVPLEGEASWALDREGRVTFIACVDVEPGSVDEICGERSIVVDDGPPVIELSAPLAGQELLAAEAPTIEVAGRVLDSHGELRVFVNGARVLLDEDGGFSAEVAPEYGVNHVEVAATDALNRLESRIGRDVLWAPRYVRSERGLDGTIATTTEDALVLQLNQTYLDADEEVVVFPEDREVTIRDLAGLFEFVARRLDVAALVPDPAVESDLITLRVLDVDLGSALVDMALTEQGVEVFLTFPAVEVVTEGTLDLLGELVSLDGGFSAWLSAVVDLQAEKARGEELAVEVRQLEIALENAEPEFESAEADALFQLLESVLFTTLEDVVVDEVVGSVVEEIPALLGDTLRSIDGALSDVVVPLDLGFGDPVELLLNGSLATLRAEERTRLRATLDFTVGATREPRFPSSRGVIRALESDAVPPLFTSSRVQIGVLSGLVNGLLHTLWNAGLIELSLSEDLPAGLSVLVETVEISGKLPPVLTQTRPSAAAFPFVLSVGQLELTLAKEDRVQRVGATVRIGAGLDVVDGALQVRLQTPPDVDIWELEPSAEPFFEDVDALEDLVSGVVWPEIAGPITESLNIPLPGIDLSGAAALAEGVSGVEMVLTLDNPVEIRGGAIVVDGAFDAVVSLGAGSGE